MKRPTDTQALLERWRNEPIEPGPREAASSDAAPSVLDHGAQIRAVSQVLGRVAERQATRGRQRRLWLITAAAAGVFGLAFGGWQLAGSLDPSGEVATGVLVERASSVVRVVDGDGARPAVAQRLVHGDALETYAGDAELGFPSGARVQVSPQSRVQVLGAQQEEAFFLSGGTVEVEVPKLGLGQFAVQTPDARVVVHGTHFSVRVDSPAGQPQTRVDVSRGVVSVESHGHEVWLTAGQHWPLEAASPAVVEPPAANLEPPVAPTQPPAAADVVEHQPVPGRAHAARRQLAPRRAEAPSPALAEQNRRFARAMELKKGQLFADALLELERLAQLYPRSVLRQEIVVERFRLLERLGRHRDAARVARSYLGDYENGYARQEARDIALGVE